MFNLFKNNEPSVQVETTSNYPKEVQEIHHAFETAADRLLEEAKSVIDQSSNLNLEKIKRLSALGFKQANEVENSKKIIEKVELSEEQIKLIKYYSANYPNNKFITGYQVAAICLKYNLVFAEVDRFKGFVPEKNLIDIENFSLKTEDIVIHETYANNEGIYRSWTVESFKKYYGKYLENDKNLILKIKSGHIKPSSGSYLIGDTLKICAPIKDMDIRGLELKDGYRLEKHIPDPVVLQPVKDGYLVVTAWGDEANDPILKN